MSKLAILEQPIVFPPKRFLLIVWVLTLSFAIYGFIATPHTRGAIYVWIVIGGVAIWQLWTLRWVQVDRDGIRTRNIFQRGRGLRWEEVTRFHEEEVHLNKGTYAVLFLSNEGSAGGRRTKISLTNDQVDFNSLREIVRESVPKKAEGTS
jgi:Bacterial PH domain